MHTEQRHAAPRLVSTRTHPQREGLPQLNTQIQWPVSVRAIDAPGVARFNEPALLERIDREKAVHLRTRQRPVAQDPVVSSRPPLLGPERVIVVRAFLDSL